MPALFPDSVSELLPLAPALTAALPASVTSSVPWATLKVVLFSSCGLRPTPRSVSFTDRPLISVTVSSSTACGPGTVLTGARLTTAAAS